MGDDGRMRWWEGRRGTNRIFIGAFAALGTIAIVVAGVFTKLLPGDTRQLVVILEQGVTAEDRDGIKQTCGELPGIDVVADRGNPSVQSRFPVRFLIGGSTDQQEAALRTCIEGFEVVTSTTVEEG